MTTEYETWPIYYYQQQLCHALCIVGVDDIGGGAVNLSFDGGFPSEYLTSGEAAGYMPVPGDYLIRYADDSPALCPRATFEANYVLMGRSGRDLGAEPPPGKLAQ